MKLVQQGPNYLVFDDFLADDAFRHMWSFFHDEPFRAVQSDRWITAFRPSDGQPMWSDVYTSEPALSSRTSVSITYPSGKGIDALFDVMLANKEMFSRIIGVEGTDWDYFFGRPYLYPSGTGLSWHSDGRGDIAGAYVYYAHPEWKAQWGAELLIDQSGFHEFEYPEHEMYDGSTRRFGSHLDGDALSSAVTDFGVGHYVLPNPNRFVLLRPGVLHRLNPVHPAAGDHVRASVTGFFLRDPD